MLERFSLDSGRRVADFGCGPGLYTNRLAAAGARVIGIDFSERSIRHARQTAEEQGLSVEHFHADYLKYETHERFDLITMIMCDFCALSPDQRRSLLAKFHSILQPGGSVLLDVYSLSAFAKRKETSEYALGLLDGLWSAEPYFGFLNTFRYEPEKVVLDKYTIIEEARTRVVYNWLQYFDSEALGKEFESCGFVVDEFLSDVAGSPFDQESPEFAIIAKKPGKV